MSITYVDNQVYFSAPRHCEARPYRSTDIEMEGEEGQDEIKLDREGETEMKRRVSSQWASPELMEMLEERGKGVCRPSRG